MYENSDAIYPSSLTQGIRRYLQPFRLRRQTACYSTFTYKPVNQNGGIAGDFSSEDDRNVSGSKNYDPKYRPNFIWINEPPGDVKAKDFAERYLLPFVHEDIQQLADIVRRVVDFPCPGTVFHDVLGVSRQRSGLTLTTSLLQSHFAGRWRKFGAVVTCETGGIDFATPLVAHTLCAV